MRLAGSLVWLLLVCYPDPRVLWRSVLNTARPPVDKAAVRDWAKTLPDDPALIEQAVLARITYALPWRKDGVPWTFPTPAETMARGAGDCQGRAMVFASVLAAKGIPFQVRASLDHMWVEYGGRPATRLENDARTLWMRGVAPLGAAPATAPSRPAPKTGIRLPRIDWAESYRVEKDYFWDAAPLERKLLLLLGLALVWLWPAHRPRLPQRRPAGMASPVPLHG